MLITPRGPFQIVAVACLLLALAGSEASAQPAPQPSQAQTGGTPPPAEKAAQQQFDAAMRDDETARQAEAAEPPASTNPARPAGEQNISMLELAGRGGIFMYPIYMFSFITVLFAIERGFGLRQRKVIPPELVTSLGDLGELQTGFDPRKVYRLCQQYPSTASRVIRAGLLKIGRPHAEIEQTVVAASEREAAKLYNNIRPLNLSASAGPLLGLLGTVQGMIIAFHDTAHLPPSVNKAEFLAEGVYIALVTTFAGLCVAIPAVCIAHFYEGKIQRLFAQIDEIVAGLLPQLERYEGKLRVTTQQLAGGGGAAPTTAAAAPAARKDPRTEPPLRSAPAAK